jgi:DNA ligase-associated metallophosphoesterase
VTSVSLRLGDQTFELLPDRAAFWHERRTLLVADCHLGKSASFRHHGLAVPEGGTGDDLERLSVLLAATGARRLLVVGDLFHAPSGFRPEVMEPLVQWRQSHGDLRITLVRGNHDRSLHRLPAALALDIAEDPHAEADGRFVHDPALAGSESEQPRPSAAWTLCGHLHPAVRLGDRRVRGMKAPCFWLQSDGRLVLPSFGSFTGGAVVTPACGDRVFAIAGARVLEVPPVLLGTAVSSVGRK